MAKRLDRLHREGEFEDLLEDQRRHGGWLCDCAISSAAAALGIDHASVRHELRIHLAKLLRLYEKFRRRYELDILEWCRSEAKPEHDLVDAYKALRGLPKEHPLSSLARYEIPFVVFRAWIEGWYADPDVRPLLTRCRRRAPIEISTGGVVAAPPEVVLRTWGDGQRLADWMPISGPALVAQRGANVGIVVPAPAGRIEHRLAFRPQGGRGIAFEWLPHGQARPDWVRLEPTASTSGTKLRLHYEIRGPAGAGDVQDAIARAQQWCAGLMAGAVRHLDSRLRPVRMGRPK